LLIEAYVEGNPELRGDNNSEKADSEGLSLRMYFDPELVPYYEAFVKAGNVLTVPFDLYTIDWFRFAWKRQTPLGKPVNCLFVDPTRLHPTLGRSRYINSIINSSIDRNARSTLNSNYRQLKVRFNDENDVETINTHQFTSAVVLAMIERFPTVHDRDSGAPIIHSLDLAAVVSVITGTAQRNPAFYHSILRRFNGLSHITVEIHPQTRVSA
jgi:hypothetical protein